MRDQPDREPLQGQLPLLAPSTSHRFLRFLGRYSPSVGAFCGAMVLGSQLLQADQVEMRNGDRYVGEVMSLDSNTLTLKNPNLGTVRLGREQISGIHFGPAAEAQTAPSSPPFTNAASGRRPPHVGAYTLGPTNAAQLSSGLRNLGTNASGLPEVHKLLSDAGPEATAKFNELLSGFLTGKLNVDDIRAQAKSAADQLRAAKKDMGEDSGMLDMYLSVLDHFVQEAGPSTASTNSAAKAPAR